MAGRQKPKGKSSTEQRGGITAEKLAGKALGELVLAEGLRRAGPDADRRQILAATNQVLGELRNTARELLSSTVPESTERTVLDVIADIKPEDCGLSLKAVTREIEVSLISAALERTDGNKEAAAKVLELSHRALLYKMKEYAEIPDDNHITSGDLSVKKATRALEEKFIRAALEKTEGNRTNAAKLLEISHRALLYKMKDYGITDL